jgi:hypothetical protein
MYFVKGLKGGQKMVSRLRLEQLRMLMDWQLRRLGYDPDSVTALCLKADEAEGK